MAEAGCLPLHLAIIQRLAQLAVRLVEKNPRAVEYPTVSRAKQLLLQSTGFSLPKISSILRSTDREWYAPVPQIDNYLRNTLKAGTNKTVVLPTFKEFVANKYPSHQQIFTDGSKDGLYCGAGVVLPASDLSFRLPNVCSIFSAEAFALQNALTHIDDHQNVIVFTDSASCLDALKSGRSKHPWIQSVEKTIEARNITLSWIPGHSAIPGNEQADKLAKQGRNQPLLDIAIPAQDIVLAIKKEIWTTWEAEWYRSHGHLRQIKHTPIKHPDQSNSSDQRILTRLRIGHTRLTHSYILDGNPPPICNWCGVQLTVQHILVNCRGYDQIRAALGINGSIADILKHSAEVEKLILKFMKKINLYKEI